MNLADGRKPLGVEPDCEPRQRGPQSAVDVSHLSPDEAAHQHVRGLANRARAQEDVVGLGMGPVTAADRLPGDGFGQAGNRAARRFEDDTLSLHKGHGLFRRHHHAPAVAPPNHVMRRVEYRSNPTLATWGPTE